MDFKLIINNKIQYSRIFKIVSYQRSNRPEGSRKHREAPLREPLLQAEPLLTKKIEIRNWSDKEKQKFFEYFILKSFFYVVNIRKLKSQLLNFK